MCGIREPITTIRREVGINVESSRRNGRLQRLCQLGCVALLLSACSHSPPADKVALQPGADTARVAAPTHEATQAHSRSVTVDPASARENLSVREPATAGFVNPAPPAGQPQATAEGGINLNFQDTDLREFARVILNDVLGENYVIDGAVQGSVTLNTARPVHPDTALSLLEDVLAMHGAALIRQEDLYRIVAQQQVAGQLSPAPAEAGTGGHSVRVLPLTYIAATDMHSLLEPFMAEGANVRIDARRNLLVVSGTQREIAALQDAVALFDVDWLRGMSIGLHPLEHVTPGAMKVELDAVLNALDTQEGEEPLGGLVRIVTLDRLHSILLVGSTAAALREAETWLQRLDRAGEGVDKRLYVYHVQNAKANELGAVLGRIFNVSARDLPGETQRSLPLALPQGRTDGLGAGLDTDGLALSDGQDIDIITDAMRNALVILARPQEYKLVRAALTELDQAPLQVLIEASIIEVSLRDELDYGVEWFFKNNFQRGNVEGGRGALDLGAAGIAATAPSFSYTVLDNADQARIALNALEQETQVNILSSPSLMVLDNQTAFINVGDEIPVPARQSVSNTNPDSPTVNEIQFRQTGITLTVTPRVNHSGRVTMEIRQEVSSAVGTTSSGLDAPTIQQRQVESTVAVHSGETLVLGGLIQDTASDAESGIPGLRRIPLLGKLFGETREEQRRTELLVLITPRVVVDRNDVRQITDEFREKLRTIAPPGPV